MRSLDRVVDITEENLEDLLIYDDLFLDYFNAFLALPVFPQALYYNRLTGTFLEVQGDSSGTGDVDPRPVTPPYGATDEDRERMLEWAREERLPVFLRSRLFREFKFCKLLLRPLDEQNVGSRSGSSRQIRGYSRQTESYVSSLSNSADNSANVDADFDDDSNGMTWAEMRRFRRPGSRAVSLPTRLGLAPVYSNSANSFHRAQVEKDLSRISGRPAASAESKHPERQLTEMSTLVPTTPGDNTITDQETTDVSLQLATSRTSKSNAPSRTSKSGKSTHRKSASTIKSRKTSALKDGTEKGRSSRLSVAFQDEPVDFDLAYGEDEPEMNGETYVDFSTDLISDQQTETDVRQLEGKHQMTFHQMKEQILGSVLGMEQFKTFLSDTVGGRLFEFWQDCEFFKDSMEDFDEQQTMASRNALYRQIQDKYVLALTEDAKRQISQSATNAGLSHTIFIRTQYDVLRRLRAYWVPRLLIHKERLDELSIELRREITDPDDIDKTLTTDTSATSFFPSISLVNSLPVRADHIMKIATANNHNNWEAMSKGGRKLDDRVKSAKPNVRRRPLNRTLQDKLQIAMLMDKASGSPFKMFLEDHEGGELLPLLSFWESVTEYGMAQDRSADRLLRMCHAWNIFNKYIAKDSPYNIGAPPSEQDSIHHTLLTSHDFVEANIFNNAQEKTLDQLEKAWLRFLKEDLKAYLEVQAQGCMTPPSTAEDIEVYLDHDRQHLVVRRPRPWTQRYPPSTDSERGRRLRTALSVAESIDEGRRAEIRRRNREKRKAMEKERRKAVRAAKQRMRDMKRNKGQPNANKAPGDPEGGEGGPDQDGQEMEGENPDGQEEKNPTFVESVSNKAMMNMFKKYLIEMEGKDAVNHVNLYLDVDAYFSLADAKNARQKKDAQANTIYKSYMEQGSRKKVHLSDRTYNRMKTEKERPRSPTLKEAQQSIIPRLEELFKTFWEYQADEMGVDNQALSNMSKAELALRADDSMLNWSKKKGRGGKLLYQESIPEGSIAPSKSDYRGNGGSSSNSTAPIDENASAMANVPAALLKLMNDDDVKFKIRKRRSSLTKNTLSAKSESQSQSGEPDEEDRDDIASRDTTGRRRKRKADGRAQPTREDKIEFLMALSNAAAGKLPMQMMHFYKYLLKHGEEDGVPHVDKDLFFYCEVHKFKECSHQYSDEEMLRRKVQSLLDCYLECNSLPHCQIDIPSDVQQKTLRSAQKYLSGKDINVTVFDEAQYSVFRELLPYWAGFQKNFKEPKDPSKVPMTKKQRERLERLEAMMQWRPPSANRVNLPMLPKGTTIASFTYTLGDGIKWREGMINMDDYGQTPGPAESTMSSDPRRSSMNSDSLRQSRRNSVLTKA